MASAFAGQVAIVTGGAGAIGLAVARKLAGAQCKVCLVDLKEEALNAAEAQLKQTFPGAQVMSFACDAGADESADAAMSEVVQKWGRLDVLVQAAGITGVTGVQCEATDPANFDLVIRINLRAIYLFCRAALKVMKAAGYGRIVNIASVAGKEGNAGMLAYSASKAAVIGLTKVVGKEVAAAGDITCNAVAPAVVRTPMVDAMPDTQVKYMTDRIPKGRTCTLDEVSSVILFAASRACSFTTGFVFDATGGRATY